MRKLFVIIHLVFCLQSFGQSGFYERNKEIMDSVRAARAVTILRNDSVYSVTVNPDSVFTFRYKLPITAATQTAINLKANLASPTFTGTVAGVTATMVGLGNVPNESKATMFTNATFTGTFTAPNTTITNAMLAGSVAYSKLSLTGAILNADLAGSVDAAKINTGVVSNTEFNYLDGVTSAVQTQMDLKAPLASPTFTGTVTLPASTSLTTPVIGVATGTSLAATGAVTSSGGGIGYATGAGGAVTQTTNKSTGVTLSKQSGEITMNNAALAAATIVSFTLTNTTIAATDVLILNHVTTGTRGAYTLNAQCQAGSAVIYIRNNTAGSLGEAIVIRFTVIKGVTN